MILAIKPFHGCDYLQNVEVGKSYDIFSPEYNPNGVLNRVGMDCRWEAVAPAGHILVLECDDVYMPLVRLQFFFYLFFVCLLVVDTFAFYAYHHHYIGVMVFSFFFYILTTKSIFFSFFFVQMCCVDPCPFKEINTLSK